MVPSVLAAPSVSARSKAAEALALAAFLALAALVSFGAPSAMAETTTLCIADGSGCGLSQVHEVSIGKAKLLTNIGTTECNVLFSGAIATKLASPLVISGSFTYSNCELGGSSCTVTEENGPAEIKVLKEGHETAKVTGEYLIHFSCGSLILCSFNGTNLVGTAKGPLLAIQENGEVKLSEQTATKEAGSGFICPKTNKLDITTSPLSATYISDSGEEGVTVKTTFTEEEKGNPKTGTSKNPFDLEAKIVSIDSEPGKGGIVGGTCIKGQTYTSLQTCTVVQAEPVGSTVSWLPK